MCIVAACTPCIARPALIRISPNTSKRSAPSWLPACCGCAAAPPRKARVMPQRPGTTENFAYTFCPASAVVQPGPTGETHDQTGQI
jgi:hypothetical protein